MFRNFLFGITVFLINAADYNILLVVQMKCHFTLNLMLKHHIMSYALQKETGKFKNNVIVLFFRD